MRAQRMGISIVLLPSRRNQIGPGADSAVLAQRGEARPLQVIALEEVAGVEGDEAVVGVDDVEAAFS
jgi:hypothetical protein